MHRINRFRRPSLPPAAVPSEPSPPAEPPATCPTPESVVYQLPGLAAPVAFRVGDYEVGDGFCPHLWGHPDIRY